MRLDVRSLTTAAAIGALVLFHSSSARADDPRPDGALAFVVGAATFVAGIAVGATLISASGENPSKNEAGWLVMEGGLVLAPMTAHGVVGEWGRGAAYAAMPAAAMLASVPIFLGDPDAVGSGSVPEEGALGLCLISGMATALIGVVDASFAPARALRVAPMVGPHSAGLIVGGVL
jgi:hypothetical protein